MITAKQVEVYNLSPGRAGGQERMVFEGELEPQAVSAPASPESEEEPFMYHGPTEPNR